MCALHICRVLIPEEPGSVCPLESPSETLFQYSRYDSRAIFILYKSLSENHETKNTFRWKIFFIDQLLVPHPHSHPIFLISHEQFYMVSGFFINKLLIDFISFLHNRKWGCLTGVFLETKAKCLIISTKCNIILKCDV